MKCRALSKSKKRADDMTRLDKIIHEKAKEEVFKQTVTRTKAFDSVVLLTIHEMEGYGKQRLEKFYKTFIDTYNDIYEKYEMGTAVISKLKDFTGVDMDELYIKYVNEDIKPERDWQKELDDKQIEIEDLEEENRILKEQVQVLMSMNNIKVG